ncbi:hypothetical protein I7I53_00825 [Histoplasma capsulatum var. duboisii H88]|uniref:Uncharacterized protein n=1 Tax=Ajellomyces capsulatus (strain H88) TaxID=544711 RepID=A0A8A1LHY4_AJEC8|nr:hypothetical protein I7I53_00825 [Histoplasma capsulatum var. duboisii H88]
MPFIYFKLIRSKYQAVQNKNENEKERNEKGKKKKKKRTKLFLVAMKTTTRATNKCSASMGIKSRKGHQKGRDEPSSS